MEKNLNTEKIIEALLFWKGEPVSKKELVQISKTSLEDVESALENLSESLKDRGVVLVFTEDTVMLGTHPEASKIIEEMRKEELSKELSKATLETLSIVLYMHPIRRSLIDYIRGVNSQFSLRHLEMRGFVEKVSDENDSRVFLYRPTLLALSFLGVSKVEDIEGFLDIKEKLSAFMAKKDQDVVPDASSPSYVAQED